MMNILFGLIPVLTLIPVVAWLAYSKVIKGKTACGLTITVIIITAMYSFQTYGPRNALARAKMPAPPRHEPVKPGSELVPKSERVGQFDDELKNQP